MVEKGATLELLKSAISSGKVALVEATVDSIKPEVRRAPTLLRIAGMTESELVLIAYEMRAKSQPIDSLADRLGEAKRRGERVLSAYASSIAFFDQYDGVTCLTERMTG